MDQRFLVFALVVVPVLSVCLGFTVHYAIRPMVELIVDALHDIARFSRPGEGEIARLAAEVRDLREAVERLEAQPGDEARRVGSAPGGAAPRLTASGD